LIARQESAETSVEIESNREMGSKLWPWAGTKCVATLKANQLATQ